MCCVDSQNSATRAVQRRIFLAFFAIISMARMRCDVEYEQGIKCKKLHLFLLHLLHFFCIMTVSCFSNVCGLCVLYNHLIQSLFSLSLGLCQNSWYIFIIFFHVGGILTRGFWSRDIFSLLYNSNGAKFLI